RQSSLIGRTRPTSVKYPTCMRLFHLKAKPGLPHVDRRTRIERDAPLHRLVVDDGSVGCSQIGEDKLLAHLPHDAVLRGDEGIDDAQVVVGAATDLKTPPQRYAGARG